MATRIGCFISAPEEDGKMASPRARVGQGRCECWHRQPVCDAMLAAESHVRIAQSPASVKILRVSAYVQETAAQLPCRLGQEGLLPGLPSGASGGLLEQSLQVLADLVDVFILVDMLDRLAFVLVHEHDDVAADQVDTIFVRLQCVE